MMDRDAPSPNEAPSEPSRPSTISATMLDRLRHADAEAWTRLVKLMGPAVYQWCRRAGLQAEDAADVTQEVFQAVFGHLPEFRRESPKDTFRGWVWTITRNKIRDHFRSRPPHPVRLEATEAQGVIQQPAEPGQGEAAEPCVATTDCLIARRALQLIRGDFSQSTWQAFWSMAIEGRPSAEVTEALGVTREAARRAKYRVLRRFREEVEGLL